jgi:hypothetical protein
MKKFVYNLFSNCCLWPEAAVRIEMQTMYSAVCLEKFALTETAGYSACEYLRI